ncbi:GGDEF domain-containing protein [Weissella coleopterorum]|uniref:GGDEF domain-containing protein n=1 Tax=Weissella coleopterorum TaxID=2714949 RepID=A0A6G8B0F8_9LACO|nr:GGDEF domain-containing protein [Weissella coleopterorum]QIL50794.1 GGDEF domain-containing protein [Weissella coleopterorum]
MLNNMLVTANQFFDVFIHVFNASSFEGLFIVFGLIIICYIAVGMLDDNFFQNRALQKRTAMIVGFVPLIAVLFLQLYWMATKADKLSLYESNLQLVLIFYFLLMFNTKIQVYVDSALAIVLTGIFILDSPDYISGSSLFIGLVGLILIIITMYIIQKYAQKIVESWLLQVTAVLFFANAWWLMLSLSEDVSIMLYIALVLKFIFFISIILGINQIIVRRWQKYQQMMDELNKDFLTGIFNREAFDEDFTTLFIESNQTNFDWTFIMFDIDNFKSFNDNYGHLMGDEVLKEVTKTVQETLNHSYIGGKLYRLGGEEFGILIRKQDHERIEQLVRQIGSEIHSIDIKRAEFDVRLSISMGMTMFRADSDANVRQIYDRADGFVYYSKQHGKDALTDEGNLIHFE